MSFGTKKFYKIYGLNYIFNTYTESAGANNIEIYDTSTDGFVYDLEANGITNIDEHTILFITANINDEGKYVKIYSHEKEAVDGVLEDKNVTFYKKMVHNGDTMIWARGDLYGISTKCVTGISVDDNWNIIVKNSDGTDNIIKSSDSKIGYVGSAPVKVEGNTISLDGLYYDEKGNFIVNDYVNEVFYADANISNTLVTGFKNVAYADFQQVFGKYSAGDSKAIFIVGGGESDTERFNLFTINFDGVVYAKTDVTCGGTKESPDYKLSDIHSVLDVDWAYIKGDFKGEDSYDESFDGGFKDNVDDVHGYMGSFNGDYDVDFD